MAAAAVTRTRLDSPSEEGVRLALIVARRRRPVSSSSLPDEVVRKTNQHTDDGVPEPSAETAGPAGFRAGRTEHYANHVVVAEPLSLERDGPMLGPGARALAHIARAHS